MSISRKPRIRTDEKTGEVVAVLEARKAAPASFSWGRVPKTVRAWLREVTAQIRSAAAAANEQVVRIGKYLLEVKARLKYGTFCAWVAAEFPWSDRTARRLMRVAEVFGTASPDTVSKVDQTALYQLAAPSVPEAAREKVVSLAAAGERVTRERAAEIVAEAKGAPVKRPSPPPGEDLYTDRLDAAIGKVIKLHGDPYEPPATEIHFTYAELYRFQRILFRENYPDEPAPAEPTDTAPGSDAKIRALIARAAARQPLHVAGDAVPDDEHVLDAEARTGGAGKVCENCGRRMPPAIRVKGWKKKA